MKVKDLIEILKTFDENLEVVGEWKDIEYGLDMSDKIAVGKALVKKVEGVRGYHNEDLFVHGKQIPSTDVEVLKISLLWDDSLFPNRMCQSRN